MEFAARRALAGLLLLVASICGGGLIVLGLAGIAHAAPAGMTFCAGEEAMCVLPSAAWVTVGAGEGTCSVSTGLCTGAYTALVESPGSVLCSVYSLSDLAGYPLPDPASGQVKSCFYQLKGASPEDPGASSPSGATTALVLPDWLSLSPADGLLLGSAIIGVWASAFAIRAAIAALNAADDNGSSGDV